MVSLLRRAAVPILTGLIRRATRLGAACLMLVSVTGLAAHADQTDPRLDALFERLQDVGDAVNARATEEKIWTIWLEIPDPTIDMLLTTGIDRMNRGDYRGALESFDAVIEAAPDFAEGWNKRATVHYLLDNLEESLADIEETLSREPRHFGALSGRGLVHIKRNDLESALTAFEAALVVHPQMTGARINARSIRRILKQREI